MFDSKWIKQVFVTDDSEFTSNLKMFMTCWTKQILIFILLK